MFAEIRNLNTYAYQIHLFSLMYAARFGENRKQLICLKRFFSIKWLIFYLIWVKNKIILLAEIGNINTNAYQIHLFMLMYVASFWGNRNNLTWWKTVFFIEAVDFLFNLNEKCIYPVCKDQNCQYTFLSNTSGN